MYLTDIFTSTGFVSVSGLLAWKRDWQIQICHAPDCWWHRHGPVSDILAVVMWPFGTFNIVRFWAVADMFTLMLLPSWQVVCCFGLLYVLLLQFLIPCIVLFFIWHITTFSVFNIYAPRYFIYVQVLFFGVFFLNIFYYYNVGSVTSIHTDVIYMHYGNTFKFNLWLCFTKYLVLL